MEVAMIGDKLAALAGIHDKVAADVGALDLVCDECGHRERASSREVSRYLASGWPKHCGHTMKAERPKESP
jgi:hypothetical protein